MLKAKTMRGYLLTCCLVLAVGLYGCGSSHKAEDAVSIASAQRALSRSRWHIRFLDASDKEALLAGRVIVDRSTDFRFVVLNGREALSRALATLPVAFRRLLRPDFGEATLLGEGPFVFVADAGRGGTRSQKRRELAAQYEIEERLCKVSNHSACPAV